MSYRKGYRREKQARHYMEQVFDCECIESRGSHGIADLICGDGTTIYVIQVKGGKTSPKVDWRELEQYAKQFKGVPLIMYKPDYHKWVQCWNEDDLTALKVLLKKWF